MLYNIWITYAENDVRMGTVKVNNKWDLFGYIGYLRYACYPYKRIDFYKCKDQTRVSKDILDVEKFSKNYK